MKQFSGNNRGAPAATPTSADLYERFLTDRTFAARVRVAYLGVHDVADAVWWLEHVGVAPSGAADPRTEHDVLAHRAYARGADPVDEVELQALDATIENQRQITLTAVATANSSAADLPDEEPERSRGKLRVLVPIAVLAIIIAAVTVSIFSVNGAGDKTESVLPPKSTPQITPSPTIAGFLAVYDRPAVTSDAPSFGFGAYDPESFRKLADVSGSRNKASPEYDRYFATLYAAKQAEEFCLVLGTPTTMIASSCAAETEALDTGVTLAWESATDKADARWTSSGIIQGSFGIYSQ